MNVLYSPLKSWEETFIPDDIRNDPELLRRCRLITAFTKFGIALGFVYSLFYFLAGFFYGGLIITITVLWMGLTWPMLLHKNAPALVGNYLSLLLTVALVAMALLQGGIHSPSVPWLAGTPLICLLIAGRRSALFWSGVALLIATAFAFFEYRGVRFPVLYPAAIHNLIVFAGYSGLVIFVGALASIIETNRLESSLQLQSALQRLADAHRHLSHLYQEKNEFLGIAAHDLKNPLTIIMGTAHLIQRTKPEAKAKIDQYAASITDSATRMHETLCELLDLNAFEENRLLLRREKLDFRRLLEELMPPYLSEAEIKNVRLEIQAPATPLPVQGDRRALSHIINNLLSNALKYSPPGSRVQLRLHADGPWNCLEVQDEGPGIPDAQRERLFRKFSRLETAPARGESSHGLGLFIVKKFTEALGGTITCAPYSGQGACFILRVSQIQTA